MTLTPEQTVKLIELYAEQCVEDMDIKCLIQFVYDTICENMFNAENEEELFGTISEVYDEELLQKLIESAKS
jgi:hypothetical protein